MTVEFWADEINHRITNAVGEYGEEIFLTLDEAKDIFMLIEKQGKKRIIDSGVHNVGKQKVYFGYCPTCNRKLYSKTSKFCQYCGQRIEW